MKWSLILLSVATMAMAEIRMSDAQINKMGILTDDVHLIKNEAIGPFIGFFEYSDRGSKSYTLSSEATVSELMKQTGDRVKKGEAVCKIASADLLAQSYEWQDLQNRLKLAQEYAKKDAALYKDGVISQRESQKSTLEMMSLKAKAGEIESRFIFAGADIRPQGGMMFTIRAYQEGIIAHAPMKAGDKIDPFIPYLKIADADAFSAYIKIPPKMIPSIHKGALVKDKSGNQIGTITAISSSVDKMSNSATAIAAITKRSGEYRAGTSNEFFILSSQNERWILLPRVSVTKYKNKDICFMKTAGGFTPKTVEIQKIYKEHVAVKPEGFTLQSRVVTEGIVNLKGALSGMGFE